MRSLEGNVFPQLTFAEFLVTWEGYKDGHCARDDILMTHLLLWCVSILQSPRFQMVSEFIAAPIQL